MAIVAVANRFSSLTVETSGGIRQDGKELKDTGRSAEKSAGEGAVAEKKVPLLESVNSESDKPLTEETLKEVVEALGLERFMNRGVRLEVEKDLEMVVAKVIDKESGDIVKQIPFEELIAIFKRIREQRENGLFVNEEA